LHASLTSAPALQQEKEAGQFWTKALLRSLVDGYSQGLNHAEQFVSLTASGAKSSACGI